MNDAQDKKSLFTLIGELPQVISQLISSEIERIKVELGYKAKNYGVGIALVLAAVFVAVFLLGTLIATGIIALALVMPAWAAALTVSGILLLIILVLLLFAVLRFRRAGERLDLVEEVHRDIDLIKGAGPSEY